jgi:hypothetical protein
MSKDSEYDYLPLTVFKLVVYFFIIVVIAMGHQNNLKHECKTAMIASNRTAEEIIAVCDNVTTEQPKPKSESH